MVVYHERRKNYFHGRRNSTGNVVEAWKNVDNPAIVEGGWNLVDLESVGEVRWGLG